MVSAATKSVLAMANVSIITGNAEDYLSYVFFSFYLHGFPGGIVTPSDLLLPNVLLLIVTRQARIVPTLSSFNQVPQL